MIRPGQLLLVLLQERPGRRTAYVATVARRRHRSFGPALLLVRRDRSSLELPLASPAVLGWLPLGRSRRPARTGDGRAV